MDCDRLIYFSGKENGKHSRQCTGKHPADWGAQGKMDTGNNFHCLEGQKHLGRVMSDTSLLLDAPEGIWQVTGYLFTFSRPFNREFAQKYQLGSDSALEVGGKGK